MLLAKLNEAGVLDLIRRQPLRIAELTGVEQIGYLQNLTPPEPLPSLDDLEAAWKDYAKCSAGQRQKVLRAFQDLRATTRIDGLRSITPAAAVAFQDAVYARDVSGKQQSHLFSSIRTLLRFCRNKRAMAPEAIAKALEHLSMLTPDESATALDPKPVERTDWDKLLAKAKGDDVAMILLMLNGAFYAKEVIELEWSDIKNGCITTNRNKTGKCVRVCVLWQETIGALTRVKRRGEKIFFNYAGTPITISGAQLRFSKLATAADVSVTASQLRDGAYTAAVAAGVNSELSKILVGHRSGLQDNYVLRRPAMVAPACQAVYDAYFA
ncbi:MAG: hypothetical protein JWM57_3766 [Phycisphaerales bacterium]|nr:hypothetical protein [Phycisphaerales bacterium]